jgi:hypothetical protein
MEAEIPSIAPMHAQFSERKSLMNTTAVILVIVVVIGLIILVAFLRAHQGKNKTERAITPRYTPYRNSDVDIAGLWIHQEPSGTFYHHFYYVDKELRFDTFQVTYQNKLGVYLRSSDIKWDGNTLRATQVSNAGFKVHTELRIRGDLLEGTVRADNDAPDRMTIRRLPNEITNKEIANLKELGAPLESPTTTQPPAKS